MGGIDWLFGVVLAGFLFRGLCRGLLVESLSFFGLLASAAVAFLGAGRAAQVVAAVGVPAPFSLPVAGTGLFLIGLLVTDGAEQMARTRLAGWRRTRTDRAGGAFAGVLKGALLLGLLAALLLHDAAPRALRQRVEEGALPRLLAPAGRGAFQLVQPILPAGLLARGKALGGERRALEFRDPAPADPPGWVPVPRVRPA
ncbi:MAG: CvpA family protein [candidate division NC10 bacterium]|nr:CvpA family protein [candidate division NC10 bacterium]